MVPSEAHEAWHTEQMYYLKGNWHKGLLPPPTNRITIEFVAGDKRSADCTNKAESIMDLLVDAGIIADDNWFVAPRILLVFKGVDKENPRAEITIETQ